MPLTEIEFQRQLVGPHGLATMLGWQHVHHRPAKTEHGWRTPVSGELGKGWPDLVLVRERDSRLIFAELKSDAGRVTPDEQRVLEVLRSLVFDPAAFWPIEPRTWDETQRPPRVDVVVWRPRDFDAIAEILR